MVPQLFVEFLPTLFREENSGVLELDAASGARDVIGKPMRPFHVEVDIVRAPSDQGRSLQSFQAGFNGERVLVVESGKEALRSRVRRSVLTNGRR